MKHLRDPFLGLLSTLALLLCFGCDSDSAPPSELEAQKAYLNLVKMLEEHDIDKVEQQGNSMQQQYAKSIYTTLASMRMAAYAAEQQDFDQAASRLSWTANHSPDPILGHLARVRLIRIYLFQNKTDEAQSLLNQYGTLNEEDPLMQLYAEAWGDLEHSLGHYEKSKTYYQQAIAASNPQNGYATFIKLKSDSASVTQRNAEN